MHQISRLLFSGLVALSLTVTATVAHASWSASITDVMNLVYCLVGAGDCGGLQPGADTIDTTLDNVDDNDAAFQLGVSVLCEGCYNEGVASVSCADITSDNQDSYDAGFAAGVASVDTSCDSQAISGTCACCVVSDATVTDAVRGITWSKVVIRDRYCEPGTGYGMDAQNLGWNSGWCDNADAGLGEGDWRMPTKAELESVISDWGDVQTFIDTVGFTDNQAAGSTSIRTSSVAYQGAGCYVANVATEDACTEIAMLLEAADGFFSPVVWNSDSATCALHGADQSMCTGPVQASYAAIGVLVQYEFSEYWTYDIASNTFTAVKEGNAPQWMPQSDQWPQVYGQHWMWAVHD